MSAQAMSFRREVGVPLSRWLRANAGALPDLYERVLLVVAAACLHKLTDGYDGFARESAFLRSLFPENQTDLDWARQRLTPPWTGQREAARRTTESTDGAEPGRCTIAHGQVGEQRIRAELIVYPIHPNSDPRGPLWQIADDRTGAVLDRPYYADPRAVDAEAVVQHYVERTQP